MSWRRAGRVVPKSVGTKLEPVTMETTNHANRANMSERILWKDESYRIVGACFAVYNEVVSSFLEAVYTRMFGD